MKEKCKSCSLVLCPGRKSLTVKDHLIKEGKAYALELILNGWPVEDVKSLIEEVQREKPVGMHPNMRV